MLAARFAPAAPELSEDDEFVGKRSARIAAHARGLDLGKLELGSLQRYRKAYKLPDFPAATRDELVAAILSHFANVCVDEDETLIKFAIACRRNGQRHAFNGHGVGKHKASRGR